jgi:PAS fold
LPLNSLPGDYACSFVSENLRAIMGYRPQEMTTDPKGWPDHLHPDDAPRVFDEMARAEARSNIGSGTVTVITFGSKTPSRSSMTTPVAHLGESLGFCVFALRNVVVHGT